MTLRKPFLLALVGVSIGLAGGTALDERPQRPVVERAGYWVLEADFHVHTRFSDGFLSPFDIVLQAERRGLDALAVTEHNILFPALMARWFSERTDGPTIVIGEEITTKRFHVIGIGLTETVSWDQPLEAIIATIHSQGGAVIAAHPVARFWPELEPMRASFDAAELMHPIAFGGRGSPGWSWDEMRDFYESARRDGIQLAAIGSSDYHFFSPLGVCRTLVFAENDSADAIVEAVLAGRTITYDLEGRAYGDAELIAALDAEPYTLRAQDYNYRGTGWSDRFSRTVGWLGLVGLLVFRRRRPVPPA